MPNKIYREQQQQKMFPIDDICNVDAARKAAQRLFSRYKEGENQQRPGLGKKQVNRLMKATYQAINMPYDPNEEDIFSFIDVFDSNSDGKIELKDIEEMAVKYLCGTQDNQANAMGGEVKTEVSTLKSSFQSPLMEKLRKEDLKTKEKNETMSFKSETSKKAKINIQIEGEQVSSPFKKVYTPLNSIRGKVQNPMFSPKMKQSGIKEELQKKAKPSARVKTQAFEKEDIQFQKIIERGLHIFKKNSDLPHGISEAAAGRAMIQTYELFGRKSYKPTQEDIKLWIKLCDPNKDGVVQWQDYKHFLKSNYERSGKGQF